VDGVLEFLGRTGRIGRTGGMDRIGQGKVEREGFSRAFPNPRAPGGV
jgi:hypothetical protein